MKIGKVSKRRAARAKLLVLLVTCSVLALCVVGSTLAWLTDTTDVVRNTFTQSKVDVDLTETLPKDNTAQMVPGWTIGKDPVASVSGDSEDSWLFVKITETANLDDYLVYAIADLYDPDTNPNGWQIVQEENENHEIVIGRKVLKTDATRSFAILGAGSYTDPMDPNDVQDDFTVEWDEDHVCVKPSVTNEMMAAIGNDLPELSFQVYGVQLYKSNETEFTAQEAWAQAAK